MSDNTTYSGLGYAYDKVVFEKGHFLLESELNTAQELQEILSQKSTSHLSSGWMSFRPYYTSNDLTSSFYTQDPDGAKPEVALVNGWSIYVTNTNTPIRHLNKIDLSGNELRSGSRVDGVFLEVWRAIVSPEDPTRRGVVDQSAKPQPLTKVSDLHGVFMFNEDLGWSVGDNGVILKTTDGGIKWVSVSSPINVNINKIKFLNETIGYAVGDKGTILKSIDSGSSWFILETSVTDNLNDIYIISATNVCVVGDNGIMLLTNDGSSFTLVAQVDGNTSNLNSVAFYDTAVGWAVGDSGALLITKDGGNIWESYPVIDSRTSAVVTSNLNSVAFYNMNDGLITGDDGLILKSSDSGYTWTGASDRIWVNGAYTSLQDLYPTQSITLNKVFIKEDFPIKFTIAVYPDSRPYFKNITYSISPSGHPNALVLEYTGVQDNDPHMDSIDLDQYDTADALRDEVNRITSTYKLPDVSTIRVFQASIAYTGKSSAFRPTSGSISSLVPAEISFSVEDKAWIACDNGLVLITSNSGSKWEFLTVPGSRTFYDLFMLTNSVGWFVGADGLISLYDPVAGSAIQTSDLNIKTIGRIYPEGNILSGAEDYLTDDIIDPQVGIETTKRVQIQYQIRVVDGVNPFEYPEAGIGMPSVYSLGHNIDTNTAGNYSFENMGSENGDYGLWRARCRNTYDGYSWAIPMFFVTRRNSASFNIDTNINGSTYFEFNAVRPDGLTYDKIIDDDVIDLRRQVVINSYSYFLQKNFDNIMANRLRTNVSDRELQGLQYGTTILALDSYTGTGPIQNLVRGGVNSSAVMREMSRTLDPNIQITEAELTFGPVDNALFANDTSLYSAVIVRNGQATNEPVAGTFEGFGTRTVKFNLAQNFMPAGGTLTGIQYLVTTHYLDYSAAGLSRVPQVPVSVKYRSDPTNINTSFYFNGADASKDSRVYEYLTENVTGYQDYTVIYSAKYIPSNLDDQDLYEALTAETATDTDRDSSLRKYEGQQYKGSLVEYHYFFKAQTAQSIVRIPKDLNGYSILGVKKIQNVNGTAYKISANFASDMSVRDRETVDTVVVTTNLVIYLDEAFVIPPNATVEVILEALVTPDTFGGATVDMGVGLLNSGETQQALRTSLVSNFNIASKGVGGMYVGILYPVTISTPTPTIPVDLAAAPSMTALQNASVMGLSSYETKFTDNQMYVWYKSSDPGAAYYTSVPVSYVEGMGTPTITIKLAEDVSVDAGTVLVPLIAKMDTMPGLTTVSTATAFYKYVPYQCVGNLPSELKVEVLNVGDFVYISNLGTGAIASVSGEPYEIPLEHIAINNADIATDNYFSNIDDMDFANFKINTGFVKLPAMISSGAGEDLVLSSPNNTGDRLGRPFYQQCLQDLIFDAEGLIAGNPRKVFIPVLARVRSSVLSPVMRGEIILLIFTKVYMARLDNKTGYYEDENEEYKSGYVEKAETAVSVYRLFNKPILRK